MQINKILGFLLVATFCLISTHGQTQTISTNDKGEKIIVYNDGSWNYYDNLDQEEKTDLEEEIAKKKKKRKKNKPKNNKKPKKVKKPKISKRDEQRLEAKSRREAIQRADWAAMEEIKQRQIKEEAIYQLALDKKALSDAYRNTAISAADLDDLEAKMRNQEIAVNHTEDSHQEAETLLEQYEDMIDMKKSKRDKLLAKMNKAADSEQWDSGLVTNQDDRPDGVLVSNDTQKSPMSFIPATADQNREMIKSVDLIQDPPKIPCEPAIDEVDTFTGKRRFELNRKILLTHTADRLKPYFKDKNHITVEGYISGSSGGTRYLNLTITILSEFAQREFGVLEKGSIVNILLINEKNVRLFNSKTSTGTVDKVEKVTIYKGQYAVGADEEKMLRRSEVDKVRIVWGTGYEDYEVFELDFFIDQFNCLDQL